MAGGITADRAPLNPASLNNENNIWGQQVAQRLTHETINKKSSIDKYNEVLGAVNNTINTVKNVYGLYSGIQGTELQLDNAKLQNQASSLDLEQKKQQYNLQSIQNSMQLQDLTANNEFISKVNEAVGNQDYNTVVNTCLDNPYQCTQNEQTMFSIANSMEAKGNVDGANQIRNLFKNLSMKELIASNKSNGKSGKQSIPDSQIVSNNQSKLYQEYQDTLTAIMPDLTNETNAEVWAGLGLNPEDKNFGNQLPVQCVITPTTSTQDNEDLNTYNQSKGGNSTINAVLNNKNTSSTASKQKFQYLDIKCIDPNTGDYTKSGRIKIDLNRVVSVPSYDTKGNLKGYKTVPIANAIGTLMTMSSSYRNTRNEFLGKIKQQKQYVQNYNDAVARARDEYESNAIKNEFAKKISLDDYSKTQQKLSNLSQEDTSMMKSTELDMMVDKSDDLGRHALDRVLTTVDAKSLYYSFEDEVDGMDISDEKKREIKRVIISRLRNRKDKITKEEFKKLKSQVLEDIL